MLADQFIAEAKTKATGARSIANLPQYVDDRLIHLLSQIERIDNVKGAIESVRQSIPSRAIEAERESTKHGSQQGLI